MQNGSGHEERIAFGVYAIVRDATVKDRLEEIANTINWVADAFDGDIDKTTTWFKVSNPLLGDISPKDMIRLGRYERLRNFIIHAMQERNAMNASRVAPNQA